MSFEANPLDGSWLDDPRTLQEDDPRAELALPQPCLDVGADQPIVGALITGRRTDFRVCREAVRLSHSEHGVVLLVVRGSIHTTTAITAGFEPRRFRHDVEMSKRQRASEMCEAHGLTGHSSLAMIDRLTPQACAKAAAISRCGVLVVSGRSISIRRQLFTRAAKRAGIGIVVA